MSGTSYTLEGQETELKKHVGHKVEVTGTTGSASGSSTGTSTTGSASGTSGTATSGGTGSTSASSSMGGQTLRVTSVRMISADCSSR